MSMKISEVFVLKPDKFLYHYGIDVGGLPLNGRSLVYILTS